MANVTYNDFVNNYLVKDGMLGNAVNLNKAPDQLKKEVDELNQLKASYDYVDNLFGGFVELEGDQTIAGVKTFSSTIDGSITGNSATATKLATARTIGGVSFDGSANINLPGVNIAGNQNTSGNAATVTNGVYTTGNQTIGGVKTFSSTIVGSVDGNAGSATKLATARTINGVSFDGTANIVAPTNLSVTNGTTAGFTIVSSSGTNVVVPTASATISGVITTGNQTIAGVKTFSSSPIVPTPTTGTQAVNKDYVDNLKTIATGTATFNSTTNNINLTGIGVGVEIGDVIQITGADDAKNNSEFTVEVITDNNNIIVNQAHANIGTTKNVANRSGDTGVTVKLLAKWYNAPIGLGQGWVNMTASRAPSVVYTNPTGRPIAVSIWINVTTDSTGNAPSLTVGNNQIYFTPAFSTSTSCNIFNVVISGGAPYEVDRGGLTAITGVNNWSELR